MKRDDISSAKPKNINLLPEINKNPFREAKEAPPQLLVQPSVMRNTGLEPILSEGTHAEKSQPILSEGTHAEMNIKTDMYGYHLDNSLCKDLKVDQQNYSNDFQTITKIKRETIKENGDSLCLDIFEESSMTTCTGLAEENQRKTSSLDDQKQGNGKTLKTNSSLIANTDEFEQMCRIKRPMNSFILYSKDNRRIVCA